MVHHVDELIVVIFTPVIVNAYSQFRVVKAEGIICKSPAGNSLIRLRRQRSECVIGFRQLLKLRLSVEGIADPSLDVTSD